MLRRRLGRLAVAASVLLAFGVAAGVGLWAQTASADSSIRAIDGLIDWNVQLASVGQREHRGRLYAREGKHIKKKVKSAKIRREDRSLVDRLLENGSWLASNSDPLLEAERFTDVAELLAGRLREASARRDAQLVQKLTKQYSTIAQRGVRPSLDRAKAMKSMGPEGQKELRRVTERHQATKHTVEGLLKARR